jgi:assimilatory nitrate reductase catalytic subunit
MPQDAELAEYTDRERGLTRIAVFRSGRLEGCVFVGPARDPLPWDVMRLLFQTDVLSDRQRCILLSGRSDDGAAEIGPQVCACFGIGRAAIRNAIAAGATSVADIGRALRAGTNCGSCVPELRGMIESARTV